MMKTEETKENSGIRSALMSIADELQALAGVTEPTGSPNFRARYVSALSALAAVEGSGEFERLIKAAFIVQQLRDWIDNTEGLPVFPIPALDYSPQGIQITIGTFAVYDSEEDEPEEMTVEFCKQQFIESVQELALFTK